MNNTLKKIAEKIRNMSREEFLASLRRAGIIDKHNRLTAQYKKRSTK